MAMFAESMNLAGTDQPEPPAADERRSRPREPVAEPPARREFGAMRREREPASQSSATSETQPATRQRDRRAMRERRAHAPGR